MGVMRIVLAEVGPSVQFEISMIFIAQGLWGISLIDFRMQ